MGIKLTFFIGFRIKRLAASTIVAFQQHIIGHFIGMVLWYPNTSVYYELKLKLNIYIHDQKQRQFYFTLGSWTFSDDFF